MQPFRAPRPTCTRCGAPNPDHLSPTGDMVCRACATLSTVDAQLAKGRSAGKAGSIAAIVLGSAVIVVTLMLTIPNMSGSGYGKRTTGRLLGLGVSLGLVVLIAGIRNLKIYGSKKG